VTELANCNPGDENLHYFRILLLSDLWDADLLKDPALLEAYFQEKITDGYVIWTEDQDFALVEHPSVVYGKPDTHKCVNGKWPLHLVIDINASQKSLDEKKINCNDFLSRIFNASADILYSDLKEHASPKSFTLASSSNEDKCSWHIIYLYSFFIDYCDLKGFIEKVIERIGRPYADFIDLGLYKSQFSF
jgi:hypothetical protein